MLESVEREIILYFVAFVNHMCVFAHHMYVRTFNERSPPVAVTTFAVPGPGNVRDARRALLRNRSTCV